MKQLIAFVLVGLSLAACATQAARIDTPSGRPEAHIAASPDRVKAEIVSVSTAKGLELLRESSHQVITQGDVDDVWLNVLFGSQAYPQSKMRITYIVVPEGKGSKVRVSIAIVSNPGSAFEKVHSIDNAEVYEASQNMIERLAKRVEV